MKMPQCKELSTILNNNNNQELLLTCPRLKLRLIHQHKPILLLKLILQQRHNQIPNQMVHNKIINLLQIIMIRKTRSQMLELALEVEKDLHCFEMDM